MTRARHPASFRFTLTELSGGLGDLGTFLPLVLAMSIVCGLDFGVVLVWAGVASIATGVWSRQPIPVQPMKAIAAVAISERLLAGEIAAAGMLMGAAMLLLGATGAVGWAGRRVPRAIVRGIQLGVGLKLALRGAQWLAGTGSVPGGSGGLPFLGWDSLLVAGLVAAVLLAPALRPAPVLLLVFLAGFGLLYLGEPAAFAGLALSPPRFAWSLPDGAQWLTGLGRAALPQLPLTLLNSVIAVCALSADYFPGRGIPARRMATSIGLLNLLFVPVGGVPLCHGAGGLAAQYQFGARTGGSMILLGALKLVAGLLFGGALVGLLSAYPVSILAVLLVFAGARLASAARDVRGRQDVALVALTAVTIVAVNTLAGFVTGSVVALALAAPRRTQHERSAGGPARAGEREV